jgi:hypothetical protein
MLRDKHGKFCAKRPSTAGAQAKTERWDDRERSEIVARLAQGWLRSLERLHSEAVKLRNRRIPHGRNRED